MSTYTEEELKEEELDNLTIANKKIDTLFDVISVFQTVIREKCESGQKATDVREEVLNRIPNLGTVLQGVAMSVASSLSTMSTMSFLCVYVIY